MLPQTPTFIPPKSRGETGNSETCPFHQFLSIYIRVLSNIENTCMSLIKLVPKNNFELAHIVSPPSLVIQ